jgi:hypothetical protein
MSDPQHCCNAPELRLVRAEPHGDGTADLTVHCEACGSEWILERAYLESVTFEGLHDNEADEPEGASERILKGRITYRSEVPQTEPARTIYRWLLKVRDEGLKS